VTKLNIPKSNKYSATLKIQRLWIYISIQSDSRYSANVITSTPSAKPFAYRSPYYFPSVRKRNPATNFCKNTNNCSIVYGRGLKSRVAVITQDNKYPSNAKLLSRIAGMLLVLNGPEGMGAWTWCTGRTGYCVVCVFLSLVVPMRSGWTVRCGEILRVNLSGMHCDV
jgi:hypothetical protein